MAISGSTDFNYTVGNLLTDALKLMGIGFNGETATAEETNDALRALETLLKLMSKKGLKLWQRRTKSITLVALDADYTLGPAGDVVMDRPEDIIAAYRKDSNGYEVPLRKYNREQYLRLPNKVTTGAPLIFYYDPQRTAGILYLWNVPDSSVASEYTVVSDYKKLIDDADATTNDLEVPQEWYQPLKWLLAKEIMMFHDIPEEDRNRISSMAKEAKQEVNSTDIHVGTSYFMRPTRRGR